MAKSKTEQRAEDQDAAIETAFVEGTLPDVDRRAQSSLNDVDAAGDAYVRVLDTLPAGSRILWDATSRRWNAFRGPGSSAHGSGFTLSRAIKSINSTRGLDENGKPAEFAESGEILAPEVPRQVTP